MNITASSPAGMSATANLPGAGNERRQSLKSMMAAIQSGDIGAAQTAFASLTADRAPPANSPLAAIGSALRTADVATAQKAAEAWRSSREHRGLRPDSESTATAAKAATAAGTAPGSTYNVLA